MLVGARVLVDLFIFRPRFRFARARARAFLLVLVKRLLVARGVLLVLVKCVLVARVLVTSTSNEHTFSQTVGHPSSARQPQALRISK